MSEQTMWAVKTPEGEILLRTIAQSDYWAKRNYVGAEMHRWVSCQVKGFRCVRVRITEVQDGGSTMGEVKRYDIDEQIRMRGEGNCDELVQEVEFGDYVKHSDYARLERERDQAMSAHADMVREVEASQAEMARLRAVEKAAGVAIEGARVARDVNGSRIYIVKAQDIKALAEACGRKG